MRAGLLALLLLGGDWSRQPIDPKANPDGTAYTIGAKTVRIGLVNQQIGLLDNLDVGTRVPLWALGVANVGGKVHAIQTKRIDVALSGELLSASLEPFGVPGGNIRVTPIGWRASGLLHRRFSVHGGTAWTIADASGSLRGPQLIDALESVTGADLGRTLGRELGDAGVYGGATLTLFQTQLMADYRLNRRDSIVLRSNNYLYVQGLVAAGVDVGEQANGTEVEAGVSARVKVPLTESVPTLTTLSWQMQWRRAALRVGVPLPLRNTFAWLQAVDFYVLLGKGRPAPPPAPAPPPPPEDTGTKPDDDTGAPPPDDAPPGGEP
jgi:hypothetical protein